MKLILPLFITIVLLSSCKPESNEILFSSPDGKIEVRIAGERTFQLDPWQVTIGAAAYGREEADMTVELQIKNLTEEFVSWVWKTDRTCLISFKHADGSKRVFRLAADEKFTHIVEVPAK